MKKSITRRTFLKGSLAASGLTIAAYVTPLGIQLLNAAANATPMDGFKPVLLFREIGSG